MTKLNYKFNIHDKLQNSLYLGKLVAYQTVLNYMGGGRKMSVKHVIEYYKKMDKQRSDMLSMLELFDKQMRTSMVDSEKYEQIKKMAETFNTNYQRLSYVIYLLNQPNKKKKQQDYARRNKKFLQALDKKHSLDSVLNENSTVLKSIDRAVKGGDGDE